MNTTELKGEKFVIAEGHERFPEALAGVRNAPKSLYGIGSIDALQTEGVAIIGARRHSEYGKECAERFAKLLTEKGITLVSGGARGCDTFALDACVAEGGRAVVFLGGGCDRIYPAENTPLFQRVIDNGGAIVSEHEFYQSPIPSWFRARNRLIAGLSKAVFIIEAGLPSGSFATADDAISIGKEVWALPGSVTAKTSRGTNRLIYQGATPIVDESTFADQLFALFGKTVIE